MHSPYCFGRNASKELEMADPDLWTNLGTNEIDEANLKTHLGQSNIRGPHLWIVLAACVCVKVKNSKTRWSC